MSKNKPPVQIFFFNPDRWACLKHKKIALLGYGQTCMHCTVGDLKLCLKGQLPCQFISRLASFK